MSEYPRIVESFPLTVHQVCQPGRLIPVDSSTIYYHYTTRAGLEGILRDGGLRASYRMRMNDQGEFDYAKKVIYEALDEAASNKDLPGYVQSMIECTGIYLEKLLTDSPESSDAYCACLTVSSDHLGQWERYAEKGNGYAIGFDLNRILNQQKTEVCTKKQFTYFSPVIYKKDDQIQLVKDYIHAGISDRRAFFKEYPNHSEYLNAMDRRITIEIITGLFVISDFIKNQDYESERELRILLDPNDGTLNASNIQHCKHDNDLIPYLFFDLRNPNIGRIPLSEIKIGPKASFSEEKIFLDNLLDELGYGNNFEDRPRIIQSEIK